MLWKRCKPKDNCNVGTTSFQLYTVSLLKDHPGIKLITLRAKLTLIHSKMCPFPLLLLLLLLQQEQQISLSFQFWHENEVLLFLYKNTIVLISEKRKKCTKLSISFRTFRFVQFRTKCTKLGNWVKKWPDINDNDNDKKKIKNFLTGKP